MLRRFPLIHDLFQTLKTDLNHCLTRYTVLRRYVPIIEKKSDFRLFFKQESLATILFFLTKTPLCHRTMTSRMEQYVSGLYF